jgi:hypothetical protein
VWNVGGESKKRTRRCTVCGAKVNE